MNTSKLISYLYPQEIEVQKSEYNGTVRAMRFLGKPFIEVDNLTQSGGLVTKIWQQAIDHLSQRDFQTPPSNILILGLGAGSSVEHINQKWPKSRITGIEIDPVMIKMGKKYFRLDTYPLKIYQQDVFSWLPDNQQKFDLILVDLYQGKVSLSQEYKPGFLSQIKKSLTKRGCSVFNLLTLEGMKEQAENTQKTLESHFDKVVRIPTTVNRLINCSTSP